MCVFMYIYVKPFNFVTNRQYYTLCVSKLLSQTHGSHKIRQQPAHRTLFTSKKQKLPTGQQLSIFALQMQIYWWKPFRDNERSRECLISYKAGRNCFSGKYSLGEMIHLWRHYIWSPYKLCCNSGTAQTAQYLVQQTGVTE